MGTKTNSSKNEELFIVDNSDEKWKALRYLSDWCQLSKSIDIATAYFEIGALLALKDKWQDVDKIRILMGDEVSKRTQKAIRKSFEQIKNKLDQSLEEEKQSNDFLNGVQSIVDALITNKIECRVFRKNKFHAKTYITHARMEVIGSTALVGSSNFTQPGLVHNVELNVQIRGAEVGILQDWYEKHWEQAEDVTPEIIRVIERHSKEYKPYDVWIKAMSEYLHTHEKTVNEWEQDESKIYKILAKYQKDGYHGLLKRAEKYGGALLCDGVGLGKTFIGLMLIERFLMFKQQRKSVALFVPKAAREVVWESTIKQFLPAVLDGFLPFKIFNHTDLHRDKLAHDLQQVRDQADVIIIDEAHHFRNRGIKGDKDYEKRSRYFRMMEMTKGKQVFHLTATPINNRLLDLKHLIDLFTQEDQAYFANTLGIPSLQGYFRVLEKRLEELSADYEGGGEVRDRELNISLVNELMDQDRVFKEMVIQRSRRYIKESVQSEGDKGISFPEREHPKVAEYSVKKTYGQLLEKVEEAFNKQDALFILSIYNPYLRYIGDPEGKDPLAEGRQTQVVRLIRLGFLKRFESSAQAFDMSCKTLMFKLLAWIQVHTKSSDEEKDRLKKWKRRHADMIDYVDQTQKSLFDEDGDEVDEDVIPPEFLDKAAEEELDPNKFNISHILNDAYNDLDQLCEFIKETKKVTPAKDDKLQKLIKLLKSDKVLKSHKVLIFSEFKSTARYLKEQLVENGIEGVAVIDSSTKENRANMIRRFSPYYNGSNSAKLAEEKQEEIRVLVSTDVLAEGLNLQDCTRVINYDIHWNPVRLMQRIGRVDRRMDPDTEARMIADHPEVKQIRGKVAYWNFLPPEELEELLRLYKRVANKTLRISKALGVEGRKLLRPDDEYDDMKNFDEQIEGKESFDEKLHLEFQALLKNDPEIEERLRSYPSKLFSGKASPEKGAKGVFFCYALPAPRILTPDEEEDIESEAERWSIEAGTAQWYFVDLDSGEISHDPQRIARLIRSTPETTRRCQADQAQLSEVRQKIEKEIKNTYFRNMQAPAGVKPVLKAWMEVN